MLPITIPAAEQWDEINKCFINTDEQVLMLEHSLASISKWESKWHRSFFSNKEKSYEETIDYIKHMTLNEGIDPMVYYAITQHEMNQIGKYIEDPMTAVSFLDDKGGNSRECITAEIVYYWMISLNIPFECQYWHFNRLIALIKVCNIKNGPTKKMSKKEIMRRNSAINDARRKKFNTKG